MDNFEDLEERPSLHGKIQKVTIEKIKPLFELKGHVHLGDVFQGQRFVLNGLDCPDISSRKGRALVEHLEKVFKSVDFLVIIKYGKDPLVRFLADFYYLAGETDPVKVIQRGRCLNREILEMGLAKPYDESKRKIDFSKRRVRLDEEEIDLMTGNFKAEVCMYINDCKQYLRSAVLGKPVNMEKGEFDPTEEEFLIIYGLKELKDMCMQAAGRARLDWRGH